MNIKTSTDVKVLVVSDDADFRKKIKKYVAELKDVSVDFAISVDEGIARIKHGLPDIFILDAISVRIKPQVFFECVANEKTHICYGYCICNNCEVTHPLFKGHLSREITKEEFERIISKCQTAKKSVLMVEDDRNFVATISELFGDLYDFNYVYDGTTALKVVKSKKPDLIILDINLPDINGFRLCKMLREDFNYDGKILMLTVRGANSDVKLGAGAGADEYIQKPISNEIFLKTIEKLLEI